MKVVRIELWLAKIIYEYHHKTHLPPVGHMGSFALVDDVDWDRTWGTLYNARHEHFYNDNQSAFIQARDLELMSDEYYHPEIKLASRYDDNNGDWMMFSFPRILGICSIGRPVARFKDPNVLEITRICFLRDFDPKKERKYTYPSKFIQEVTNQVRLDIPEAKFVTYIHANQSGKYLEHAGFVNDKSIIYKPGDKGWGTRSKRLGDLQHKKRFFQEAA